MSRRSRLDFSSASTDSGYLLLVMTKQAKPAKEAVRGRLRGAAIDRTQLGRLESYEVASRFDSQMACPEGSKGFVEVNRYDIRFDGSTVWWYM